ncbi:MAG: formate dehydrogenase accessory sulfurtransferase FdhD [Sphingobium sp.]
MAATGSIDENRIGPHLPLPFTQIAADGAHAAIERSVAVECPVALEFNGVGYAVLMATPDDLTDLATGFALSERLIERADEILSIDVHTAVRGMLIRTQISPARQGAIEARVRHRITESSCGLCGIENLEQALRLLPRVSAATLADDAAVFRAVDELARFQPGNRATGAMHAAALCAPDGAPLLVREDVGRHNAFDKLIGAMAAQDRGWDGGFALLSSRCSYELVEKAALAGCPMLATLSAPTSLAVERAREAGLRLFVLTRSDRMLLANE